MPDETRPRVGVYVCHWGGNFSECVDVAEVGRKLGDEATVLVA